METTEKSPLNDLRFFLKELFAAWGFNKDPLNPLARSAEPEVTVPMRENIYSEAVFRDAKFVIYDP